MKKIISVLCLLSVLLAISTSAAASASPISSIPAIDSSTLSPALDVLAKDYGLTISVLNGEEAVFTTEQFCNAAGLEKFDSIRVLSLPDENDGTLYLNDCAVCEGQVIPFEDIEALHFTPCSDTKDAGFYFTYDGYYSMECGIVYKDKINSVPTVCGNDFINVYKGTICGGTMKATDSDGDRISFEVVTQPKYGNIEYNRDNGYFTYKPKGEECSDKFSYRAVDSNGAYSEIKDVSINYFDYDGVTVFADMTESSAKTAATVLCDNNIMDYKESEGRIVFAPKDSMTRLEFLVSAMDVFGAGNIPRVSECGFKDDDDIPDKYKGYVYSAATLGIVGGIDGKFMPDLPVTRAQAAVIVNSIIGYTAKNTVSCNDEIPEWAIDDVSALYEMGLYELKDGCAEANCDLTKEDAAKMLYGVTCLLYE